MRPIKTTQVFKKLIPDYLSGRSAGATDLYQVFDKAQMDVKILYKEPTPGERIYSAEIRWDKNDPSKKPSVVDEIPWT
jgi:hypothetical protein